MELSNQEALQSIESECMPINQFVPMSIEAGRHKLLNREQECALAKKIRSGCKKSRELMINSNLRMVMKIASEYKDKGIDHDDAVQFGMLGLIRAVDKFDPDLGFRFSTYAYNWIRESIGRGVMNTAGEVRVPVHIVKSINNLKQAIHECKKSEEERVSYDDLHKIMGEKLSPKTVRDKMSLVNGFYYDSINIDDSPLHLEDSSDHVESIHNEAVSSILRNAMNVLSDLEKKVVCERFGFLSGESRTLKEISDETGFSRETIRQCQLSGLSKLKRDLERNYEIRAML